MLILFLLFITPSFRIGMPCILSLRAAGKYLAKYFDMHAPLYHPRSSESMVTMSINVYILEFFSASCSFFLVNKHKYFPISVDIGANKPPAFVPSPPYFRFISLLLHACVCAHTNRICVSIYILPKFLTPRELEIQQPTYTRAITKTAKICYRQKNKKCSNIGYSIFSVPDWVHKGYASMYAVYISMMFIAFDFFPFLLFCIRWADIRKKYDLLGSWHVVRWSSKRRRWLLQTSMQ